MAGRDGTNLWSDSFSGEIGALLEFQDNVVRSVASIIEPRIQKAELEQAMRAFRQHGEDPALDVGRAALYVERSPPNESDLRFQRWAERTGAENWIDCVGQDGSDRPVAEEMPLLSRSALA